MKMKANSHKGSLGRTSKTTGNDAKLHKPNVEAYQTKLASVRQNIQKVIQEMKDIGTQMTEMRNDLGSYSRQRDELRRKLDNTVEELRQLELERVRIATEMDEAQKTLRRKKNTVQSIKKTLGFQSEEELENRIKLLEKHLISERLSVTEENKIIAQIKQLKASKPLLDQAVTDHAEKNTDAQVQVQQLKDAYEALRTKIRSAQQKKRDLTEEQRNLVQENLKQNAPFKDLVAERARLREQLTAYKREEYQIIEEMDTKYKDYQASLAQHQQATLEKRREERRLRDVKTERELLKRELDELDEHARTPEYQLTCQALLYLKNLMSRHNTLDSEEAVSTETSTTPNKEVDQESIDPNLYIKRRDNGVEGGAGFRKSKKKNRHKKGPSSLKQPLVHGIVALADFQKLSIDPPLTLEECPSRMAELEKLLKHLDQQRLDSQESISEKKKELINRLNLLEETA